MPRRGCVPPIAPRRRKPPSNCIAPRANAVGGVGMPAVVESFGKTMAVYSLARQIQPGWRLLPGHDDCGHVSDSVVLCDARTSSACDLPRFLPTTPFLTKTFASLLRVLIIAAAASAGEGMRISATMRRRSRVDPHPAFHPPASIQVRTTSDPINTIGAMLQLCTRSNALYSTVSPDDAMRAWVASTGLSGIAQ